MFDKLIELLIKIGQDALPYSIVDQWEEGVFLRFGKYIKNVKPGIHFKFPFIEKIWTTPVITQTVNLTAQTITTADERCIVLTSIVRYNIHDIKKFLLSVMHANDVLVDTTQGIIRDIVEETNWDELVDLTDKVTSEVNLQVERWGITVEAVKFPDLGEIKTIRIISDGEKKNILPILEIDGL